MKINNTSKLAVTLINDFKLGTIILLLADPFAATVEARKGLFKAKL